MMKRAVAYLDILGFTNFIKQDVIGGAELLEAYQTQIDFRRWEDKQKYNHSEKYKELIDKWGIDSFEYYIPFSDSIFLISNNPDKFVKQLSTFIIESFLYHRRNASPINPQHPEEVEILSYEIGSNGQPKPTRIKRNWFPLLFRGGITYDEIIIIKQGTIEDRIEGKRINLLGSAVCKAVDLEKKAIKGPYLICDQSFFNHLSSDSQKLIEKLPDNNLFHILYPAYFHFGESDDQIAINSFIELFNPVVDFWKAYNHTSYSEYYFNFMKIIVRSTLRYFELRSNKELASNHIRKVIENQNLNDKLSYLID